MKKTLLFFSLLITSCFIYGQPANDECDNAIPILTSDVFTIGTTVNATPSVAPAACQGVADDDVWYSFTADATDANFHYTEFYTSLSFEIFSGDCNNLQRIMCVSSNSGIFSVGNLTVGNIYYLRVFNTAATGGTSFWIRKMLFTSAPSTCTSPLQPANGAIVGEKPTLRWQESFYPAYDIYLSTSNLPAYYTTVYNSNSSSYSITSALSPGTYHWYIVPKNSIGSSPNCSTYVRSFTVIAAPVNDNCENAVSIVPSESGLCTAYAGTTAGTTTSPQAAPSCSPASINDDVWYKFTATGSKHQVSVSDASVSTSVAVYQGNDCSDLVQVANACATGYLQMTGLTVGNTYYIRVFSTSDNQAVTSNFNICVTSPPVNDECNNPLPLQLTPYFQMNNCTQNALSTIGAGYSGTTGQPMSCTSTSINDTWYTFTSTYAGLYTFIFSDIVIKEGSGNVFQLNFYTGTCGMLIPVENGCRPTLSGNTRLRLNANTTYFLRVGVNNPNTTATFNLCVQAAPPPPENDECSTATPIPVSPGVTCTTPVFGNTLGSTHSTVPAGTTCNSGAGADDVWFSFVATANKHNIILTGNIHPIGYVLYAGNCGSLTQFAACAGSSLTVNNFTVGNTYYLRVYTGPAEAATSVFYICVTTGSPDNDECNNAQTLQVSSDNNCSNSITGTTLGATTSFQLPPSCSATGTDDDVWYKFTATGPVHTVSVFNSSNIALAIYGGSCGAFALLNADCSNKSVTATGLTTGAIYYIRIYTPQSGSYYTNFNICITTPLINDECSAATNLTGGIPLATGNLGSTPSLQNSCAGIQPQNARDAWYRFTAGSSGTALITLTNVSQFKTFLQVFTGDCTNPALVSCFYAAAVGSNITGELSNLNPGQVYYARVYGTGGFTGIYTITVSDVALPVNIIYFRGNAYNDGNKLEWKLNCTGKTDITIEKKWNDEQSFKPIFTRQLTTAECSAPFGYKDTTAKTGLHFYRLKIKDENNQISYSSILNIKTLQKSFSDILLAPNPASDRTVATIKSNRQEFLQLKIHDMSGKILQQQSYKLLPGTNQVVISTSGLAAGIYYIRFINQDNHSNTIKLIKTNK